MKFTKNWKRFWTLNRHHAEGFTLVELIVVIAILAILGGVAVPAYSGYIQKANMTTDQTLVSEVANALQLQYYTDIANATSGYVILSANGASAPADENGYVNAAMTAVFGGEWQNILSLSYDGWTNDGIMAIASGQTYIGSVSDSSFLKNSTVPELLNNVQVVTMAAAEMLSGVQKTPEQYIASLKNALGEGYLEEAVKAGIMTKEGTTYKFVNAELIEGTNNLKVTEDLQTQLSNLMVVSVAREMSKMSDKDAAGLMTGNVSQGTTVSTATNLAAMYATYKAAALNLGEEGTNRLAVVDAELAKAKNISEVQTALGYFITGTDGVKDEADTLFENKFFAYGVDTSTGTPTQELVSDSQAFAAIMGAVNDVTDSDNANASVTVDADTLKDSGLFTSDTISNQLNSFISAADAFKGLSAEDMQTLNAALAAAGDGDIVVYISSTGVVAANPSAAYTVS